MFPQAGLIAFPDGSEPFIEGDPPAPIAQRYETATDMLAALHHEAVPEVLPLVSEADYPIPVFDIDAWLIEIGLMLEWYLPDRNAALEYARDGIRINAVGPGTMWTPLKPLLCGSGQDLHTQVVRAGRGAMRDFMCVAQH